MSIITIYARSSANGSIPADILGIHPPASFFAPRLSAAYAASYPSLKSTTVQDPKTTQDKFDATFAWSPLSFKLNKEGNYYFYNNLRSRQDLILLQAASRATKANNNNNSKNANENDKDDDNRFATLDLKDKYELWIAVASPGNRIVGRIAANATVWDPTKGYVGFFEVDTKFEGYEEVSKALFGAALGWLLGTKSSSGVVSTKPSPMVKEVFGPINFSTLFPYRLKTKGKDNLGCWAPRNPPEYIKLFEQAGFKPRQYHYTDVFSSASTLGIIEVFGPVADTIIAEDIYGLRPIRTSDPKHFKEDLDKVYQLIVRSFAFKPFFDQSLMKDSNDFYDLYVQPLLGLLERPETYWEVTKLFVDKRTDSVLGACLAYIDGTCNVAVGRTLMYDKEAGKKSAADPTIPGKTAEEVEKEGLVHTPMTGFLMGYMYANYTMNEMIKQGVDNTCLALMESRTSQHLLKGMSKLQKMRGDKFNALDQLEYVLYEYKPSDSAQQAKL
ncbi:hypothetical protein HDV05_002290 [Chytridiales sp. JEL 0842]|nr:hypothetical protein HDV05_002290 [Chytridiales sp. JEL 0842]